MLLLLVRFSYCSISSLFVWHHNNIKLTYIESSVSGDTSTSRTTSVRQFKLKPKTKKTITDIPERVITTPPPTSITTITCEQYTEILKRFDQLEASVKQNHQATLQSLEMHTLIMKDVHGAVFGELKNEGSGKQAAAKRLGLLNLAEASAKSNHVSLKKLSNVEKAANASKIETEELKREIERLHAVPQQAEEINTYARSWLSEAWDNVIDEFWPHGAPTDESLGQQATGTGGCTVMSTEIVQTDRTGSGTGTGPCNVMSTEIIQAGRGGQAGSTGSCNVMSTSVIEAGRGGQAGSGTGPCNVMSTEIYEAGRGGQAGSGTGPYNVMSHELNAAGRGGQAGSGTGPCNIMSPELNVAGRGGQAGSGTGPCLVM
jgi:hypothetical protein